MDGVCHKQTLPPESACSTGKCDAAGKCVSCTSAKDCLVPECNVAQCLDGYCTSMAAMGGTPCTQGLCDVAGHCAPQCGLNLPCPGSTNPCVVSACFDGKCTPTFPGPETLCGERGPGDAEQCNGQGACVDCVDTRGCNQAQACNNGTCG